MSTKLATAIAAGLALAQMVLVPTPSSQYGHGGGMVLMGPMPQPLPPQFNPSQYMQQNQMRIQQMQQHRPCLVPGPATC